MEQTKSKQNKGLYLVAGLLAVGIVLYMLFVILGKRTKPDYLSVSNSLKNKAMDLKNLGNEARFADYDSDLNADGHYDLFAYQGDPASSKDTAYQLHFKQAMLLQLENKKYKTILRITRNQITGADGKPLLMQHPTPHGYLIRFDTTGRKCILRLAQSTNEGLPASEPLFLEWQKDRFVPTY
jgi:hypothetical protein